MRPLSTRSFRTTLAVPFGSQRSCGASLGHRNGFRPPTKCSRWWRRSIRYRAAIWLGAGEALRLGEVLSIENSSRCVDYHHRELHVVQQLRFHKVQYGGFYLTPPKSGSVGDIDLDDRVAIALTERVQRYPPVEMELPDITAGTPDPGKQPKRRPVARLFTDEKGRPIRDQRWSAMWQVWQCGGAEPAGRTRERSTRYGTTSPRP
jgi:hypothetical protein